MKKILTLMALLVAFVTTGFAKDYYVVGDLTSWTYQPSQSIPPMASLEGTTDTYYADFTPTSGEKYFCIADEDGNDWGDFNANHRYSSGTANQDVTAGCYSETLATNGERNLKINADGNTTYRLIFVASTKKLTVTKVGLEYYVAGSFTPDGGEEGAGFFGQMWNTSNNQLTLKNDGTYAITFTNAEISAAGSVAFKITNEDWSSCSANNVYKYFAQTGTYDVTFTFYIDNIDGPVCTAVKKDIPGTAIWTSETAVGAGNILISAETCAGLKVGDVLHLVVEGVPHGDTWSAQVYFEDGAGTTLEENKAIGNGGYYDMPLVITGDVLSLIKKNGLKFAGYGYSSRKVTKESQVYTGSENSVWVGNQALSWTQVYVNKLHFVNAGIQEGYTLKLTYEGNSTNIQIRENIWTDSGWPSLGDPTYGTGTATLELTAENVTQLTEHGLVINASGITMKQVEVLEPTTSEVQLTLDGTKISSNEFDKYADNMPVKITISNNTSPYEPRTGWGIGYLRDIANSEDDQIGLIGGDGQVFDIMLTVGDLKNVAKHGTDEYVASQDHPEGGVNIRLWDDYSLVLVSIVVPEESDYYLVKSDGTTWTVSGKMTKTNGVCTATVSDWAGKYFAIAPTKALNASLDGIEKWSRIVRPVTQGSDWEIDFADYNGIVKNDENGNVWKVINNNDADVVISYTPQYGTFEITNELEFTIGQYGYSTYSNAKKYKVVDATANFVTVSGSEATLVAQAADAILPAMTGAGKGSGIIISGTAGAKAIIKSANQSADAVDSSANLLAGSGDNTYEIGTQFADGDEYTAYIFTKPEGKDLGFYLLDPSQGATLAAHKAFLAIPKTSAAPSFIGFGGTTGIDATLNDNGQMINDNIIYDLSGRRVMNPTKGLYIVNGKKVVIK